MTLANDDLSLCRQAASGNRHAFDKLVEKHAGPLRSFLTHLAGASAAEDIAQDAFLKAWKACGQYDGRARFSTWLTKIAWRCWLDQKRRQRDVELHEGRPDEGHSGFDVRDMLARLSISERAALILCDGHGWSHPEAAELLGIPLGTLKSTVARAKLKCRRMWSDVDE
jgi:RNA polymerase sigma-70 factor (ECF subfamily)